MRSWLCLLAVLALLASASPVNAGHYYNNDEDERHERVESSVETLEICYTDGCRDQYIHYNRCFDSCQRCDDICRKYKEEYCGTCSSRRRGNCRYCRPSRRGSYSGSISGRYYDKKYSGSRSGSSSKRYYRGRKYGSGKSAKKYWGKKHKYWGKKHKYWGKKYKKCKKYKKYWKYWKYGSSRSCRRYERRSCRYGTRFPCHRRYGYGKYYGRKRRPLVHVALHLR